MADSEYGWIYTAQTVSTTVGVAGSIQTRVDDTTMKGDGNLTWDGSTLYVNGAVKFTGEATLQGVQFAQGNPTVIPASSRYRIPKNGRTVLYSDSDCTITVDENGILDIGEDAIVKIVDFSTL